MYTLRDLILRVPSSSLSPAEREALRHERAPSQESPVPCAEMDVTDGHVPEETEQEPAPAQAQTAETVSLRAFPLKRQPLILGS